MDNVKASWWQNHRPSTRRLVQLYSALLYNAHLKGFIDGEIYVGKTKFACVPGFNCYSCPGAVGACPLGSIQNALASTGNQAGWYVLGIISLFGVILGRTICGWLCPLGLIQELLHKIPTPKIKKSRITRVFTWLKYILLAVFVVALPLWYGLEHNMPLPGFCKYICPAGTFEGAMGLLSNPANTPKFAMLGILFTRKFIIMLGIGLLCIFCYRSFCRFICPLGAIYGFFNRFNIVGVKVDESRCNHCGSCVRSCGMDVRHVGDHECINCGKCMEVCAQKAISIKAGSYTLKAPEGGCADDTERSEASRKHFAKIFWGVALGVLCAALLWFNFLDPTVRKRSAQKPVPTPPAAAATAAPAESSEAAPVPAPAEEVSFESSAPIGYEVGQQLQDFTVSTFDGGEFHLADHRGQIVIINLWGTYCTPCVQELPEFEKLCEEHEGEVAILAVHSSMTGDVEPQDYVVSKGWDKWDIDFTLDDDNDTIFGIVNGSTTLPQTIVLNRRGEVIYNMARSLTPEMLGALYKQADESVPAAPGSGSAIPTPPENSAAAAEPAAAAQPAAVPSPALTEAAASESTEQAAPAPAAETETAENSDSFVFDAPAVGFHFEVPEKYRHLKGSLDWSGGYLDDGILQFTATYYAIPKDRIEEYFDYIGAAVQAMAAGEEVPEAPVPGWDNYGISTVAYDAFSISSDRGEEELRQELKDHNGWRGDNFGWFEKIGSDGEYSFYIGQYAELEENKEKHRDAMGDCFEEFEEIVTDRDGFISALTLKAPDQQKTNLEIGETVAFETTDLDGNPISSKVLFAAGRVTMINLWATWCHACINELPELAEIAKEYEGKGCRIVGICLDADEEGIPAEAKEILKEAGVEYLNLVPPEGVENLLPTICYPTSFLFDSEGRLIAEPIRGAHIEEYRPALDKALDQTGASSNGPDGKVL